MYYMNKRKRNLIIAAAILNLIGITISLILSIVLLTNKSLAQEYQEYYYVLSYSSNIYYTVISFIVGIIGSIFLLYLFVKRVNILELLKGCIWQVLSLSSSLVGGYLGFFFSFLCLFLMLLWWTQRVKSDKNKKLKINKLKRKNENMKRKRRKLKNWNAWETMDL